MNHLIASVRPLGWVLAATFVVAGVLVAQPALAQTPPAKQPAKPAAQKQAPAANPAEQPQQPPQQAAESPPQLMYSPWMKVCGKGPDTNNKQVCVITKDGRLENGMPVAIVQLFEPEGDAKGLRVRVPLGKHSKKATGRKIDKCPPTQEPSA